MYRTKLCIHFNSIGGCRRGQDCNYAHGIEQLRDAPRRRFQKGRGPATVTVEAGDVQPSTTVTVYDTQKEPKVAADEANYVLVDMCECSS